MHETPCPEPGCLGECAALFLADHLGPDFYEAHLYLWDPLFNDSTMIAEWFRTEGAFDVWVQHTLYSDINGDRDGIDGHSRKTRHWTVTFRLPEEKNQPKRQRAVPLAVVKTEAA